jgi:5-methyltetrahydrofolate--homocysteine methyltransferase
MDERQMTNILEQIAGNLYQGDDQAVEELVQKALDQNLEPAEILNGGLLTGMDEVGEDFRDDKLFVPEVLIAARAMHAGLDVLRPFLSTGDLHFSGKVMIGTVEGDLHDIGKNLVAMMLEGSGYQVVDLGTNVAPQAFAEAVQKEEPSVLGLSALLTTTMPNMEHTIDSLIEAGVRADLKVIIGGAPVTQDFADKIGADGYAPDAGSATELVKRLLG